MNDATEWAFSAFLSRSNDRGYVTPGDRQTMGEQAAKLHGIFLAAQDYVFAAPSLPRYVPPTRGRPTSADMRDTVTALFEEYGATPSATELSDFAKFLSSEYDQQAEMETLADMASYSRQAEMAGTVMQLTDEERRRLAGLESAGGVVPTIDPEGALRRKFREVFAGQIAAQEDTNAAATQRNSILGQIMQQSRGTAQRLGWPG